MNKVIKKAIEQMIKLGNALNWNPPIDSEYAKTINELKEIEELTKGSLVSKLATLRSRITEQDAQLDNLVRFLINEGLVRIDDISNTDAIKEAIVVMMGMQNEITKLQSIIAKLEGILIEHDLQSELADVEQKEAGCDDLQ